MKKHVSIFCEINLLIIFILAVSSINSIVQPSIRHLIVKRRLNDEKEISNLANQYPNVNYLELLFPLDKSLFLLCFKTVFNIDHIREKRCFWSELINFCTLCVDEQSPSIYSDIALYHWILQNTDLKYSSTGFYTTYYDSMFSIWL